MKFLVLGVSGMVGHVIALFLKEKGHEILGLSRRNNPYVPTICADALDSYIIKQIIADGNFDIVVNAIGVLNDDAEINKPKAVYLNSYLPHFLANLTLHKKTRIFHLSTDCVFKGNTGPYTENSKPDGESFYDLTKSLGELNDNKNLTFRNSIIGPDINNAGIGLFNWFMNQHTSVVGFNKAIWTGVTTIELAKAILSAAQSNVSGLVNLVPAHNISKYELLSLFNSIIRRDELVITQSDTFKLDKTLIRTNYSLPYQVIDYKEQIIEMRNWINSHKALYPHYLIK